MFLFPEEVFVLLIRVPSLPRLLGSSKVRLYLTTGSNFFYCFLIDSLYPPPMDFKIKTMEAHGKNQSIPRNQTKKGIKCTQQIFIEHLLIFFFSHTSLTTSPIPLSLGKKPTKYIMYIFREVKEIYTFFSYILYYTYPYQHTLHFFFLNGYVEFH